MLALLAVFVVLFLVFVLLGMAIWALISVGITGIIVGGLARFILPGEQRIGILSTVLLGWIGSVIGGFIGNRVVHTGWILTGLLEVAVAAALIGIYAAMPSRQQRRPVSSQPYRW